MTRFLSCWFLIEKIVIPDGFLKWFYLSFYIHPFLLVFCQLYLWIKLLLSLLLTFILFVYRTSCFLVSNALKLLKFCAFFFKKFIIPNEKPMVVEEEEEYYEIPQCEYQNEMVVLFRSLNLSSTVHLNTKSRSSDMIYVYDFQARVAEMFTSNHKISSLVELNRVKSMELEDIPSEKVFDGYPTTPSVDMRDTISSETSVSYMDGSVISDTELELELSPSTSVSGASPRQNEYIPSAYSSNSSMAYGQLNQNCLSVSSYANTMLLMDHQLVHDINHADEEEIDLFWQKYAESMRWLDVLNHETLCAKSEVERKQSFESTMLHPTDQYNLWSKAARKRVLRSLESDLELVYVAQSCLSWEALHYQYRKVEALCSTSQTGFFYGNVVAEFHKFQILLERYVEDDSCGGKRYSNYVHTRFSQNNLLQVPQVTGYVETNEVINGESSKAMEVLKAIEKCIDAFWVYIKADCKKSTWKRNRFLRVEDPRDIHLLHDLTKKFHLVGNVHSYIGETSESHTELCLFMMKKEVWMKDVKGKRKCWLRRAIKPKQSTGDICSNIEFVFTLIDMKLVSRVLHMSLISTTHLKWCKHKLRNIEFKDGHILRTPTTLLFPT